MLGNSVNIEGVMKQKLLRQYGYLHGNQQNLDVWNAKKILHLLNLGMANGTSIISEMREEKVL